MPRKQKPPGYENWTWSEINAGRKMSKTEKRYRRLAKHLGAQEGDDGRIIPPKASTNPDYYIVFGLLLLIMVVAFFLHMIQKMQ